MQVGKETLFFSKPAKIEPHHAMQIAAAWPESRIQQRLLPELPWGQNLALLDKLHDARTRLWYARACAQRGGEVLWAFLDRVSRDAPCRIVGWGSCGGQGVIEVEGSA